MSCILRIEGENFKVDEFLSISKMQSYEYYKKDELRPFKIKGEAYYKINGCKFDLSLADFSEFEKQKSDVISFLEQNFLWLKRLEEFGLSNSEIPEIDFGINLNPDYVVEGFLIEPKLSKLVSELNLSILMSIYRL